MEEGFTFIFASEGKGSNNNVFKHISSSPTITTHTTFSTRTRKQWIEPQRAEKLQITLNYSLHTGSVPPQDTTAAQKDRQKKLKAFLPTVLLLNPQNTVTGASAGDHRALILSPHPQYMTLLLPFDKSFLPCTGAVKMKCSLHPTQPKNKCALLPAGSGCPKSLTTNAWRSWRSPSQLQLLSPIRSLSPTVNSAPLTFPPLPREAEARQAQGAPCVAEPTSGPSQPLQGPAHHIHTPQVSFLPSTPCCSLSFLFWGWKGPQTQGHGQVTGERQPLLSLSLVGKHPEKRNPASE